MDMPPPIVTQEVRIVDEAGTPRLVLSAKNGAPSVGFLTASGGTGMNLSLDANGRPSVRLANPDAAAPTAALEIDDKGAHVKFGRPGGASSYLFLNNGGISGVVLIDASGVRRLGLTLAADGTATLQRYDAAGKPLP